MRNQRGKPECQSTRVSLLFVFHVFGSLARNQRLTSAGITQQSGTSAEPVRNESYVDISGYRRRGWAAGIGRRAPAVGRRLLGAGCWALDAGRAPGTRRRALAAGRRLLHTAGKKHNHIYNNIYRLGCILVFGEVFENQICDWFLRRPSDLGFML